MSEYMKTIPANEYVQLLNERLTKSLETLSVSPVIFDVYGTALEQRTYLHIPRKALEAVALAVFEIRQQGVLCYPVLGPLDEHQVV